MLGSYGINIHGGPERISTSPGARGCGVNIQGGPESIRTSQYARGLWESIGNNAIKPVVPPQAQGLMISSHSEVAD